MSRCKLYFYATLAAILACAAIALPTTPSLGANSRTRSQMSGDLLLAQSRNAENLSAGKLLVASRNLGDPQFAKTVILLVHYDAKGVLGLILNRRTRVPLSHVLESLKAAKDRSDPVYLGGPVEMPAVFALFRSSNKLEAQNVFDGVYLITAKTLLEQTISTRPDPSVFHVYLGYAGWSQQQLQQEVGLGAWFIFPAEAGMVFDADPDSLWLKMIRKTEMQFARNETRQQIDEHGGQLAGLAHPFLAQP
jgi:putative transcriptional regulator